MQDIKFPSIVEDMPAADYHAFEALNQSTISRLLDCPAAAYYELTTPHEPTDNMKLGTLVHALALEPETVDARYFVQTRPGNTKEGKAEIAEAQKTGREIVKPDTMDTAKSMAAALRDHPKTGPLLSMPGRSEVSIFWEEQAAGKDIACKARADRLIDFPDGRKFVLDVKTAQECSPKELGRHICKFGYHRQAAWYMRGFHAVGIPVEGFIFAFVRSKPPYLVTPAVLSPEALERGWEECEGGMSIWADSFLSGRDRLNEVLCQGYSKDIVEIDLPAWAYR